MESQDARLAGSIDDAEGTRASLQLELRVPERQMVAAFREAFLRWLNDRAGPFARLAGPPEGLSLNEVPDPDDPRGRSLLRLSVSWSCAAPAPGRSPLAVLPPLAAPVERFVFFPDPPQTGAPIFQDLPVPLQVAHVPPRQFRLESPVSETIRRRAERGTGAARTLAAATSRRLSLAGLTVRAPLTSAGTRAWGAALFGAAAIAVGFAAGSIYLATSGAPRQAEPPLAATRPAAADPLAAPLAMIPAPAMPLGAGLPRVERPGPAPAASLVAEARRPVVIPPTSSALGIADAEVTTARRRDAPAERDLARRSGPVVVRASEVAGSAGANRSRVKGTLLVRSEPQGAQVSINGVVHGRTPLVIRDLGAGSRVLRLELPGYERWSWAVAVVANQRTPVSVKLQPEPRGGQ